VPMNLYLHDIAGRGKPNRGARRTARAGGQTFDVILTTRLRQNRAIVSSGTKARSSPERED